MNYDFRTTILSVAVVVLVIFIIVMPASQVDITLSSSKKNNSYNIDYVLAKKSSESNSNNSCISCFTTLMTSNQITVLEHGLGLKSIQELCKKIETGGIGRADFYSAFLYLTDVSPPTDVQISKCLHNNGIEFAQ